jgi:hypothetical protein
METLILGLLIFTLIIVIAIDAKHKRRRFLAEGK